MFLINIGNEAILYGGQAINPDRIYPETGYEIVTATFSGNGEDPKLVTIPQNYDFLLLEMSGVWTDPRWKIDITYPNGRKMTTEPINGPSIVGSGSFPRLLAAGFNTAGGGQFTIRLINQSGGANAIDLNLGGLRMFSTLG